MSLSKTYPSVWYSPSSKMITFRPGFFNLASISQNLLSATLWRKKTVNPLQNFLILLLLFLAFIRLCLLILECRPSNLMQWKFFLPCCLPKWSDVTYDIMWLNVSFNILIESDIIQYKTRDVRPSFVLCPSWRSGQWLIYLNGRTTMIAFFSFSFSGKFFSS